MKIYFHFWSLAYSFALALDVKIMTLMKKSTFLRINIIEKLVSNSSGSQYLGFINTKWTVEAKIHGSSRKNER